MEIKYYEDVALTNNDILKLLDNHANIILYPSLHQYKSLDQILGEYKACILLFEAMPSYGHWVAIFLLDNNTIEFFNPYGGWPDDSLKHISKEFRDKTYQDKPYLSLLLLNSPYELTYNEFKFQKMKDDIKTCGRHCVVRLWNRYKSLYEYVAYLDDLCERYKMDYDGVVTMLTLNKNIS